jgi:deazaflavin-dependent oxidoreductase (nitroreductase family)
VLAHGKHADRRIDAVSDRNARIIEEFRTDHGRVGGDFEGRTLLLVTHRGRRTGTLRTNPLAYRREGERIFVFASKGGAPHHPHWYLNLTANPDVTVEIGDERFEATAAPLQGAERDEVYARQAAEWPAFGEYERRTERTIPVVELVPKRTPAASG